MAVFSFQHVFEFRASLQNLKRGNTQTASITGLESLLCIAFAMKGNSFESFMSINFNSVSPIQCSGKATEIVVKNDFAPLLDSISEMVSLFK